MTNAPTSHDFDWVSARLDCSLPKEFQRLRQLVRANCRTAQESLPSGSPIQFAFHDTDNDEFSVAREPVSNTQGTAYHVRFALRAHDILVVDGRCSPPLDMALTLTLSEEGECRFVVEGEGEAGRLRWQVVRKALYGLFFDGARAA